MFIYNLIKKGVNQIEFFAQIGLAIMFTTNNYEKHQILQVMRVKVLVQFILEKILVRAILDSALSYDEHITKLYYRHACPSCQLRWHSSQTTRL